MTTEISSSWHSYPSIFNVGHKAVKALTTTDVEIFLQEKIDGSQFSFGRFGDELRVKSKSVQMDPYNPTKLFEKGVEVVRDLQPQLIDGWTYRGEFLSKPKHNVLPYERCPTNHIVLFDIEVAHCEFLSFDQVEQEAQRLGLEFAPVLHICKGVDLTAELFKEALSKTSILGKCPVEGVVIKPLMYNLYGEDKKVLMAKYVSEAFKEKHGSEWKTLHQESGLDAMVNELVRVYATPQRWRKAIQHLSDSGELNFEPQDIPKVLREIVKDIEKEEMSSIKDFLYAKMERRLHKGWVSRAPEYYKQFLLERQFEHEE